MTGPIEIQVELGERSYPIVIGKGWIGGLAQRLSGIFPPRPCTLVANPMLAERWAPAILETLRAGGYRVDVCEIPEGEKHKTIDAVTRIHDAMLNAKHTRQSGLIALGGGVVGDIAGFAAASLLRGIAFIQMPTTLLAMVDSSVGGKTGVNHACGKNLIGAFWQPTFVAIELDWLSTLPREELAAGLAEVIKYGVIADADLFGYLEEHIEKVFDLDAEVLTHLVRRSCEIKAQVVAQDEREAGLRAILNFGHTFGHAAEALSGYESIRHGEGVAMGMVAAAQLAAARGLTDESVPARIGALCRRAGLPTQLLAYEPAEYWDRMGSDKKVRDGKIRFVLPTRMGHVEVFDDVEQAEVMDCLAGCIANI